MIGYEVHTIIDQETEQIQQIVYSHFEDVRMRVVHEVYNLKDTAVREALIKLGWTPPDDEAK